MNYPTQGRVIERLENVAIKAVDDVRKKYFRELYKQWMMTRKDLKRVLWQAYREVAPLDTWNYASAKRTGTLNRINHETKQVIERFKHNSMTHVSHALNDIYKESALHQAWILDQVTPPSYKIRLPRKRRALESGRTQIYTGADALSKWRDRWEGWLDAYHTGLNHNVGLGAINDATIDSITDEVDATKAGSPSTDIWAALQRVYMNVSQISLAFGQTDVSDENADELGTEEVWQTRYNQRVCDECDGNAGQTRDDLDDDIPAHPNCFCYWRVVPKEWASLLASGDPSEQDAAVRIDALGKMPTSMQLLGDDGKPKASVIINFEEWAEDQGKNIAA